VKTIQVKSLPFNLVIHDLAVAFDCAVRSSCGEYWIKIPKKWGKGTIRGINFDGGLGIIQYDCIFHEDVELQFIVNNVHPLKFIYCVEGFVKHSFENDYEWHDLEQYQCNILGSENHNGHILRFVAKTQTRINSLEIDRAVFHAKMDCELRSLNSDLRELFLDKIAERKFYYDGYYSLRIADIFNKIKEYENIDLIRRLYLEGKAYTILSQQILQYQDDLQEPGSRSLLRRAEIELVQKASKIIHEEISELDNIDALARRIGLNVNKLQEGFKYFYHNTVNGYIQIIRLEMAKDLLSNSDYNISEIVQKVGLSSNSYFSKIFKEKYSISPSAFRQNNTREVRSK
jgi:AraC-like DNA-binding protein